MKRSPRTCESVNIYVYKIRVHPADRKNERGELSTALLDSNVSHKLYKNEHSKLGETKYFGRYDEEAFNEILYARFHATKSFGSAQIQIASNCILHFFFLSLLYR